MFVNAYQSSWWVLLSCNVRLRANQFATPYCLWHISAGSTAYTKTNDASSIKYSVDTQLQPPPKNKFLLRLHQTINAEIEFCISCSGLTVGLIQPQLTGHAEISIPDPPVLIPLCMATLSHISFFSRHPKTSIVLAKQFRASLIRCQSAEARCACPVCQRNQWCWTPTSCAFPIDTCSEEECRMPQSKPYILNRCSIAGQSKGQFENMASMHVHWLSAGQARYNSWIWSHVTAAAITI